MKGVIGSGRQRGQALVEMAFIFPVLLFFGFACFQFAVILWAYLSVLSVGRDGGRWLAVHPHTTDSSAIASIKSRLPANLIAADLTIAINPTCASLTDGKCPGRSTGSQLSLALTYDIDSILFLGAQFGTSPLVITIPTTLPSYTIYMPVEPG